MFLKGNPFPPLYTDTRNNRNLIHNVLLDEARKEYRAQKYAELTDKLSQKSDKEKLSAVAAGSIQSVVQENSESSTEQKLTSSEENLPEQKTQSSVASANEDNTTSEKNNRPPSS